MAKQNDLLKAPELPNLPGAKFANFSCICGTVNYVEFMAA
jgi:hypothetical protein